MLNTVRRLTVEKVSIRLQLYLYIAVLGTTILSGHVAAEEKTLRVAAASDLQFAMAEIGKQFTSRTGTTVAFTYGSSGNLFAQMTNGAPFDIFLSADADYPRKLCENGVADSATLTSYARGRLVLLFGRDASKGDNTKSLDLLRSDAVKRVAIANPKHAPYGRAAEAAMKKAGVYEAVRPKLVLAENVAQAMQFVESGNADAGLVALSLVKARKTTLSWGEVPENLYPPIEQTGVALKSAMDAETAKEFLHFLTSAEARAVLARYGFSTPEAK